jgi:hypothetical protein
MDNTISLIMASARAGKAAIEVYSQSTPKRGFGHLPVGGMLSGCHFEVFSDAKTHFWMSDARVTPAL